MEKIEFVLVRPEPAIPFSSLATPSCKAQVALDEIYEDSDRLAHLSDPAGTLAKECQDRILAKMVTCFSDLNRVEINNAEDRVIDVYSIPPRLQKAIVALVKTWKPQGRLTISCSDITYALDLLKNHPQASTELVSSVCFYQKHVNFESALTEGIESDTKRAIERGWLPIDSQGELQFINLFLTLPLDTIVVLLNYTSWRDRVNVYQTSNELKDKFPSFIQAHIADAGQQRKNGKEVPFETPLVLSSYKGIQFVQDKILNCGPNTLIQMKMGRSHPERAKSDYTKVEKELRLMLPKQLPIDLSKQQLLSIQQFLNGYAEMSQFQDIDVCSLELSALSVAFDKLGRNLAGLAKQETFTLSEKQFVVLKKYIGDGLFDAIYFQRLLPDEKRTLLQRLAQDKIQQYIDCIAVEREFVDQQEPVQVKDILSLTEVLSHPYIQKLLDEKPTVPIRKVRDFTEGCLIALRDERSVIIRYCEKGCMKPEQLISLSVSKAKLLSNQRFQKAFIRSDGNTNWPTYEYERSSKESFLFRYVAPRIQAILMAQPFVVQSFSYPSVWNNIDWERENELSKYLTIPELLSLNENGHHFVRDENLMNQFVKLASGSWSRHQIGKLSLFQYWHVLKDKGIEASDVYMYTTQEYRELLEKGEYAQYVAHIVAEKKDNCVIS